MGLNERDSQRWQGVERMTLCDKCNSAATLTVSGYLYAQYLCSRHASELAASYGDTAGAIKLAQVNA